MVSYRKDLWEREDCAAHEVPSTRFYGVGDPDGDQHCFACHCICDPYGPSCGHWIGCPGC